MSIEEQFREIVEKKYDNSPAIITALEEAKRIHDGQKRESGEPFVVHPISVAIILTEYGLDEPAIVAALLHDSVEDTRTTYKEIKEKFGKEVEDLVRGVTKVGGIKKYYTLQQQNNESLRRMFISMSKDIRVVLIKLADRLHNMRTLQYLSQDRQIAMAQETNDIYVPLADRLGLCSMRGDLEDYCLKYLHPKEYKEIENDIQRRYAKSKQLCETIETQLKKILAQLNIKGEVYGRIKHISSIYKKIQKVGSDKIYDIVAHRVIVDNVQDCYAVLGAIHNKWKPVAGRIKDYIATPKLNGYRSLHSTLLTPQGMPFELQIRTWEMHKTCEYGIAAHWRYKDGDSRDSKEFSEKLDSIKYMVETNKVLKDSKDFVNAIKLDFETSEIWVLTPHNKVVNLQKGSTPIDFAYAVHTSIGHNCVGAKVNGKMVPLSTKLETGDKVEIVTSPHDKAPSRDWLNVACMASTKSKIRAYFRKEMKAENIENGRLMLELEAKNKGYTLSQLFVKESLDSIFKTYTFSSEDDLFASIGAGSLTTNQVLNRLIADKKIRDKKERSSDLAGSYINTGIKSTTNQGVLVYGEDDVLVRLCKSCSPVPGDDIVGFSVGRGITVHRKDCSCIKDIARERQVDVSWIKEQSDSFYNVNLYLKIEDKSQVLTDIINALSIKKVSINSIIAKAHASSHGVVELSVKIKDSAQLQDIINKLSEIPGVFEIFRK